MTTQITDPATAKVDARKRVPNEFPKILPTQSRIAIIGEAPGATEELQGRPFVGTSGALLWEVSSKCGIVRDQCFVGNVVQIRPPNNKIELFSRSGPEFTEGINQLRTDLVQYNPNIVVCLGGTALWWALGEDGASITQWRGSLFRSRHGFKCIGSLHPASILREYKGKTLLTFDLKRAKAESTTPELSLPVRELKCDLSACEIIAFLIDIKEKRSTISIDIEGYWNNITCISIARGPFESITIPLTGWDELIEKEILVALTHVLRDPRIPKILQNALYDTFCLQYGYSIPVRGVVDDTMLAHWELFCELPKRLSFLASIYTREPYWKDEREDEDCRTRLLYCAKDSAVTYEVRDVIRKQLSGSMLDHYNFNLSLHEPLLYMEQKGILYDKAKADSKAKDFTTKAFRLQYALNSIAGYSMPDHSAGWVDICRDVLCFKKSAPFINLIKDIVPHSKLTELHRSQRAVEVLEGTSGLSHATRGELSTLTDLGLNVESKNQMADFLYRQLGLPVQFKKEKGRLTDKETTDALALLTLYKKTSDPTLKLILKLRSLRTRLESLTASCDPDGRIRCGYNSVGTETGRLSCYESPTGSGFNLQTVTKKDRDLFLPDPGWWIFQCDLSGADGWTVAAHCAALGDPTMLDDYRAGIKPAKVLSLVSMYGRQVLGWTREKLKDESKQVDPDDWMYFARKRIQHGSNYGMGKQTMSDQILKDSYKFIGDPVFVAPGQCELEQNIYFMRYPGVLKWHQKIKQQLLKYGYLDSANGHRRRFFNRRNDHDTLKQALSDEPQNNTTYATNKALLNLWTDPENRCYQSTSPGDEQPLEVAGQRRRLSFRVQPLHQIHDALLGQFKKGVESEEWARKKIREWFNNKIVIAGIEIVIPFEGAFGESWGSLKQGSI